MTDYYTTRTAALSAWNSGDMERYEELSRILERLQPAHDRELIHQYLAERQAEILASGNITAEVIEELAELDIELQVEGDPRTDAERDLDEWQAEWQETYMSLRETL